MNGSILFNINFNMDNFASLGPNYCSFGQSIEVFNCFDILQIVEVLIWDRFQCKS